MRSCDSFCTPDATDTSEEEASDVARVASLLVVLVLVPEPLELLFWVPELPEPVVVLTVAELFVPDEDEPAVVVVVLDEDEPVVVVVGLDEDDVVGVAVVVVRVVASELRFVVTELSWLLSSVDGIMRGLQLELPAMLALPGDLLHFWANRTPSSQCSLREA